MDPKDMMSAASDEFPWKELTTYLARFGYLDSEKALLNEALPSTPLAPPITALRRFQEFFRITETDEVERIRRTLEIAKLPRCGFEDLEDGQARPLGCAWGLGQRVLIYEVENEPEGILAGQAINAIEIAVILWNDALKSKRIPLALRRREGEEAVDVRFAWKFEETEVPFIGTPLARADFPPQCGLHSNDLPRPVVFDATKPWAPDASDSNKFNIRAVAAHEIGHILGLPHSDDPDSVMFPALLKKEDPTRRDMQALARLYREHRQRVA